MHRWWTATVERYLDPIYRFVRARVPADAVDDVVQETFVAAARSIEGFDRRGPVWHWLVAIARNKVRDHYRRTGEQRVVSETLASLGADGESTQRAVSAGEPLPDEICQREEFRMLARAALSALPPDHRDYLMGRYYEDLSLEELGRRFGLSRSAVNSRLHRARQKLRETLLGLLNGEVDPEEIVS